MEEKKNENKIRTKNSKLEFPFYLKEYEYLIQGLPKNDMRVIFKISNNWSVSDFKNLFESIEVLYRYNLFLYLITDKSIFHKKELLTILLHDRSENNFIKVVKIEYNSPGEIILEAIKDILDLVFDIYKYSKEKDKRKKESELINIEIESLQMDLLERKIKILKSLGYENQEIIRLIEIEDKVSYGYVNLEEENKIIKVVRKKIVDNDDKKGFSLP